MKRTSIITAILALAFMGCVTTTPTEEQSLENKSKAVAWVATSLLLQEHPEWLPHFAIARDDLRILMEAEMIGLPEVLTIVQRLPVEELKGNDAALIIGAAMIFFADDVETIAVDNPPLLRAVCRGLISGITLGLPNQTIPPL